MWVSLVLPAGVALSMIGTSPFGGAGFLCLASLAVLPVLSLIAKKRAI
jgi:hypothetical protein